MHESQFLWDKVHRIHHGFKKPTAFAQDAAHPFEAAIQGAATQLCISSPVALRACSSSTHLLGSQTIHLLSSMPVRRQPAWLVLSPFITAHLLVFKVRSLRKRLE
jgi:sterol desaturase/sphingolipid hydroxylase (fatty acid hydroxylase superfamily)